MGREGIQLFGWCAKKQDGHWKFKAFIFLAVLQIPVEECLQYDSKIRMLNTE